MITVGVLGQDPPAAIAALSRQLVQDPEGEAQDEGRFMFHHDALRGVLYVGLPWPHPELLTDQGELLTDQGERTAQEAFSLRAALLLFLASHAVVWVQPPGTPPDARTLGTLRLLQQAKQLLLPSLPELTQPAGTLGAAQPTVPWEQPPLLLFACQVPPSAAGALTPQQLSQAQAQLDSQLRSVLRRCRVVLPDEHPAALCTLRPQTQGATCMLGTLSQSMDSIMQQAFEAASGVAAGGSGAASSSGSSGQGEVGAGGPAMGEGGAMDATLGAQLRAALQEHSTGGSGAASFQTWQLALSKLAAALQCTHALGPSSPQAQAPGDHGEGPRLEGAKAAAAWLAGCSSLVWQVSESRCQKALVASREAYLQGVPDAYPPAMHAAALQAALGVYASLARGPASLEYEGRVQAACEEAWRDGRQQCQAASVYGRPCTLAPHDPEEVPHSSGTFYRLATPSGEQQVSVPDPFPQPAGPTLGQPVQPSPASLSAAAAEGLEGPPATAPRAAVLGLYVRQEAVGASVAAATQPTAAASTPLHAPALMLQQVQQQVQVQGQQLRQGAPLSGSFLEIHVLGPARAAQAGLQQPGLLPGSSNLHRFVLQVSQGEGAAAAEEEEFPALGPAQQQGKPSTEPEVPRIYNWPGGLATGAPTAPMEAAPTLPAPQSASRGATKASMPQERRRGKKGAAGRGGGPSPAPPSVWVGLEYESLLGHRVVITPAQLAASTASSLDPVCVAGDQESSLPPCPLTDALADLASEALGAAAAAAAAAKRAAAAGPPSAGAAGTAGGLPLGGPAAQLMLSSTLPLFLHLSPEQLGAGRPKPGSASGKAAGANKGPKAEVAGLPASGCWWQLRRVFVATPGGELAFESCPLLRLEFPGGGLPLDAPEAAALAPSSSAARAGGANAWKHSRQSRQGPATNPGQGVAAAAALTYQPQQPVRLPPDALCCISLPWLYTFPSGGGHSRLAASEPPLANASTAGQGGSMGAAGAGAQAATGGAGGPASPLLWSAGPVRAVLGGGTILRPSGLHG